MARINQDLIARIADKLGVTIKAVYPRVQKVVADTMLERDLAALKLASSLGLNINRYSTPQQRADIRRGGGNDDDDRDVPVAAAGAAPRRPVHRKPKPVKKAKSDGVFVVHGRDEELRKSIFTFLRAIGLNPMEWGHAVAAAKGANPYIADILNAAMAKVQAVVVLFSPDELAQLKEHFCTRDDRKTEGKLDGQPRPNVLFEAGLALGAHPEKTLLIQVGKVRGFSDIAGKHLVRLTDDVAKRNEVASRLRRLGCTVNLDGADWTTAGKFVPTEPKARKKAR
jgi:predicted nucleotide-binding protein